ncbi:unnamed protein product [Cylindrotheca closterium]|uniref:DUF6824 domain-containing protein n=1 Tax=Cylindrotheca closterium TaxID=2856 RepID=A0AAD2JKD7_9STRA|nr:unnamed protein product [Cylindrotheca closterium]
MDLGEAVPHEKQSSSEENIKVTSNTVKPQPHPLSISSSATPTSPLVSSSPSAPSLVSGSGSTSPSASVATAAPVAVPQRPLNSTGPSPSPPTQHHPTQNAIQIPAMQVKSQSPQPPTHPPMQAQAHPLHPQGHPPAIHHPSALPPHPYHQAHMFHPHYPPPPHPHMYHPAAMWHHPHAHAHAHPPPPHPSNSSAAYMKPYSAVMRSQPPVKRTSKYMLKEQGVPVPSPIMKGSHRTPNQVESSSQPNAETEESKEQGTVKRPASEMGDSSEKEQKDVPQDLRNKKMKPTDCLLFAASLLATEKKTGEEQYTDENVGANGENAPDASALDESEYTTTGVKPAKKIFQAPIMSVDEEQEQENDENWPKDVDVLCGRGGLINKHPGNVVYRKIVDYNKPYYQSVHKKHRILVSQSIVQSILNFGGRFMTMERKEWTEIEFKRAVQKTSQALRERITEEEKNKEKERKENGESKNSEDDEGIEAAEGEDDDDDDDEGVEEGAVVKSQNISDNMNGVAKGTLAI